VALGYPRAHDLCLALELGCQLFGEHGFKRVGRHR
jgi:hypothetical protein